MSLPCILITFSLFLLAAGKGHGVNQAPNTTHVGNCPCSVVLRDLLGHLAGMGGMVSVVPLEPPETLELMEEMVKGARLEMMEETVMWALLAEMVFLVLEEQVEETEKMVLWALQVLQQDWTWKGFETL